MSSLGGSADGGLVGYLVGLVMPFAGGSADGGLVGYLVGLVMPFAGGSAEGGSFLMGVDVTLTITTETDSPSYAGISKLRCHTNSLLIDQPAAGETLVRLADAVGIPGDINPLSDLTLDVRGVIGAGGYIIFGYGNFPSDSAGACRLSWADDVHQLALTIPSVVYASHWTAGFTIDAPQGRIMLHHRSAVNPCWGFTNDDTSTSVTGISFSYP